MTQDQVATSESDFDQCIEHFWESNISRTSAADYNASPRKKNIQMYKLAVHSVQKIFSVFGCHYISLSKIGLRSLSF